MREQTRQKQITYHIYEPYDIASIRLYEEEKENKDQASQDPPASLLNQPSSWFENDANESRGITFQNMGKD